MPTFSSAMDVIIRTACVYAFLLAGVRVSGKREVGQLSPFDFVLLLVLSNAVQNAMVGDNTSLAGGLIAASTLLILTRVLHWIGHFNPLLRRVLVGAPSVLILHGKPQFAAIEREGITPEELTQILREHEVSSVADVELATLELDGNVSVLRNRGGDAPQYVKTRKHHRRIKPPQN